MNHNIMSLHNLNIYDVNNNHIIHNLDLDIERGKVNVLIGESGSGKSLTARTLIGYTPKSLYVTYNALYFKQQPIKQIKPLLGKNIGFISQDYAHSFNTHTRLDKQMIAIYRMHHRVSKSNAKQHVLRALEEVNLDYSILKQYRMMLSGGQLERLYIASILMLKPELIIADEPVASLDVINGHQIMRLIQHFAKEHGTTLLIITHNLTHVIQYADRITVMHKGRITDYGDREHFNTEKISKYAKALFNARSQLKKGANQ